MSLLDGNHILSDEHFMKLALEEAKIAYHKDEVPVGAVLVSNQRIIARGHNLTEMLNDVTAHAEMQIITMGANYLGGKFLDDCQLYVTLEPCPMCAGALYWSRIGKLIYGAPDLKRGYTSVSESSILHPKTKVSSGVLGDECGELLSSYFKNKR
ncbi:MAG: tRNA(adenine34) deaminase [Saprospiraceae bacterium]|jgi:tRNA(adenine34) deaminase